MKPRTIIIAAAFLTLFLSSCSDSRVKRANEWYEGTKAEILKQSDLIADSTRYELNKDNSFRREYKYCKGHLFLVLGYSIDSISFKKRLEIHFSKDGDFELRREICANGTYLFEGVFYKDHAYGLSTWRHCNTGQLDDQGIRFKGQTIDIWKWWDENGKLIRVSDGKNLDKLDSLPELKHE
jgi:hypothetical protein